MCGCLYWKILLTTVRLWHSFTVKLPIGLKRFLLILEKCASTLPGNLRNKFSPKIKKIIRLNWKEGANLDTQLHMGYMCGYSITLAIHVWILNHTSYSCVDTQLHYGYMCGYSTTLAIHVWILNYTSYTCVDTQLH